VGRDSNEPAGIGIVGCGNIFPYYVRGLRRFPQLWIVGVADLAHDRARDAERALGVRAFGTVPALLASAEVDVVVNLTPPAAHASVTMAALDADKDVFVEKPLATTLAEAGAVLRHAGATGGRLGCAPDTFLGSAIQTARAAVDAGAIGEPIGVAGFIPSTRSEEWHPDPTFLFRPGGGPVLDMGPYWIAALVNLFGPVTEVSGATRIGATPRLVTHVNRLVDSIDVEVATHASATLRFANGVIGTLLMSFDIWHTDLPHLEIYGTTGALRLPIPDHFDGAVRVRRNTGDAAWMELDPILPESGERGKAPQLLRGVGVADLVQANAGGSHRTSADFAYHVLEVLTSVEAASAEHAVIRLQSTCERPKALSLDADLALMPWAAAQGSDRRLRGGPTRP
jgi:predicted dehydrogenase